MPYTKNAAAEREQYASVPPRVVITGMGTVSPLGHNVFDTWSGLIAGRSGIADSVRYDTSELQAKFAGEVKDFDPTEYMDHKSARRLDECIQYAVVAAQEAIADATLNPNDEDPRRVSVSIASAVGGLKTFLANYDVMQTRGVRRISPFMIPSMLVDSPAGQIAIQYGFYGPNISVVNACATGTAACGEAFELLRRGDADVAITGGTEAALLPLIVGGFEVMGALSRHAGDPAGACRPFDAERDGFVLAEGAGVLVMETLAHAQARNARIYAEVVGYGNTADGYHMVAPQEEGRGAFEAMSMALRKAAAYGVAPDDVGYINAHGTGTPLNDRAETLGIKRVLGEHAYSVKISSTKSMLGHMLGGAGALETIICAKVIEQGIIPPTINLHHPDPDCDLDYTPREAKQAVVNVTMSNSFGFGGHNCCIMLRRYETNGA